MNRFASSPAYLNGLPPTGQTTVYVTGDNGTNQTGVPHRYELKNTGQYSGTVNIVLNGKTNVKSNAVVIDHQYKIMYSQTVSGSVGPASNGYLPFTVNGSGEGLFEYIALANAASMGGHNDWRAPTDIELLSIRDMQASTGAPDALFLSWTTAIWSSTTAPDSTTSAMYINYAGGIDFLLTKTTTRAVALVRSI